MPKPSLFLGPVVVTEQPHPKSAKEPQGFINKMLAARGEVLVRVVHSVIESARNEAEFLKAAIARGVVSVSRTAADEQLHVTRTALDPCAAVKEAGDRGEPDYVEPGPSGNRGESPSWPPAGTDGYDADGFPITPFGPARGAENGVYSLQPRKKPHNATDDALYNLSDADKVDDRFVASYAKGLTEKACAECGVKFMTAAAGRSLCAKHATSAPTIAAKAAPQQYPDPAFAKKSPQEVVDKLYGPQFRSDDPKEKGR